ncbi:hypothetical protein FOCC_FOCC014464 [Frankliniella occidentalis]|nr:hypothetical protein FOCC_FOCC014464 [Frankliniella occidentalis]
MLTAVADHNKPPQFNESEIPVLNSEWLVAGIEPLSDTANKGSTKPAVRRNLFKSSEVLSRSGKENIQNIKHQNNEISHSQADNKANSPKEAGPSHSKASTHANVKVIDTAVRKRPTHSLSNNSSEKKVKQNNDDQDSINSGSPKKKRSRKAVISRKSQRKSSAPPKYTESGSSCSSSRSASPCSIEGSETHSLAESYFDNSDSDSSSSRSLSSEKGSSPKSGRNPDVVENVSPIHIPNESPQRNGVSPNCSPQKTPKTPKTPASQKALKKAAIKLKRKIARNLGKEYETDEGKTVKDRESKRKPPHEVCQNDCFEKITPDIADTLFKEYWEQGSHNKRVAYVVARTERFGVARKRPRTFVDSREKHQNFKYFFDVNGKRLRVCRSTFLGTLGETDRFVRDVTENKKKSVSGIAKDDARGKKRPKHALKPEVRLAVLNHIESFPAYESHYCRAQTQRLYLSPELNVQKMHELYLASDLPKVSYDVYRKLFKSTKKKFHAPKSDGCDTCDTLKVQIAAAVGEEKTKLESTKELHNRKADKAYLLKREAKAAAEKDKTKRVLIFDLQQCLPTPHLKCKKIYYSRQLNKVEEEAMK